MAALLAPLRRPKVDYVEQPCRTALNPVRGMPFRWSLNPYTGCEHRCAFCYVRAFEKRAARPSGEAYGTTVRVKTNIAAVLARELARPGWRGEGVNLGAATDPYQPAEGRYRLTRACLEEFARAASPVSLITRGPLAVRDLDVMTAVATVAEFSVTFSIPTLDARVWRFTEPGTAPPRQRLRVVERLAAAGIRTYVGMAPILPGLSDRPEQMAEVVRAARAAGAHQLWASVLYLKDGIREHFLEVLARFWPEQLDAYQALYRERAHLPPAFGAGIRAAVAELGAELPPPPRPRVISPRPPLRPAQLALF